MMISPVSRKRWAHFRITDCDPNGLLENRFRAFGPQIGNQIGPEIGPGMKIGKNSPKIGFSPDFLFLGFFFPIFIPGPISGPIWFPIWGRRPETYFLAGRLDRKSRIRGVEFKGGSRHDRTATTAETAKTVKTVTVVSWHCIL